MKTTKIFLLIYTISLLFAVRSNAQSGASLHMLPDNFQAHMMNPSYYMKANKIVLAVPGLAGGSLMQTGNFKLKDIVVPNDSGRYSLRLSHLNNTGNVYDFTAQNIQVPLFYLAVPIVDGALSFYWSEHGQSGVVIPGSSYLWLKHDNLDEEYRHFNSGAIGVKSYWNHEFGFGIAQRMSDRLILGGRLKLIFNKMFVELDEWSYTAVTSPLGDEIILASEGTAYIAAPVLLIQDRQGQLQNLRIKERALRPLYSFRNPGAAIDLGFTFNVNEKSKVSASIKDLGLVWLRRKAVKFTQNDEFIFGGMDFSNSLDRFAEDYVNTIDIMRRTKNDLQNFYRPSVDTVNVVRPVSPTSFVHLEHRFSRTFFLGLTNHTGFRKNFVYNTLTLSGDFRLSQFDLLPSISLHGARSVSVGGGIQWTNSYAQLYAMTDNFMALYHPAGQETFSFMFGISFLINSERLKLWDNSEKGWSNPPSNRPFFDKNRMMKEEGLQNGP